MIVMMNSDEKSRSNHSFIIDSNSSLTSGRQKKRPNYMFKSPYSQVSFAALNYNSTERIMQLAKPKMRKENHVRDGKLRIIYLFLFN